MTDVSEMLRRAHAYTAANLDRYNFTTRRDLGCMEVRDARVTPRQYFPDRSFVGAVYNGAGVLIPSTRRFNEGDIVPADPAQIDDVAAISAVPCEEPVALYGGILFPILGHFFLESISRLWPLLWSGGSGTSSLPVYFHPWPDLDRDELLANPLFAESFRAFGLEPANIRLIERPRRFDTLIVPDTASAYHLNLDSRMLSVFDRIARHCDQPCPNYQQPATRRIFLSRSRWTRNPRISNEHILDAIMATRGFEVVHPQELGPQPLMRLLRGVDLLAATDGSHAHMAAFCRSGIQTLLFDTRPVPSQFAISRLRAFKALHLPLAETPIYHPAHGIMDPGLLERLIDAAIG